MNKKLLLVGLSVGVWVSIYAALQTLVAAVLHIQSLEIWPVLMAPGLVGLLGGGKEGMVKYYKSGSTGILAGLVFVLCEHALVPVMGDLGVLIALALIVAAIVCLEKISPDWFGAVTFVTFNASAILTDNILSLTVSRLLVLLVGGTLFLLVEGKLVGAIMGTGKQKKEAAESTVL